MNDDWDSVTYLTKSRPTKGTANEKTAIRQAQRSGRVGNSLVKCDFLNLIENPNIGQN